ncbi:MAG TPA: methyl-accepting chemotaxis protein [Chloroflexia bacterium]|nr:methyl-accepting chemotaxis protein [Chloroflexia bacterium]
MTIAVRAGRRPSGPRPPLSPDVARRRRFLHSLLLGMVLLSTLFIPIGLLDNSVPETLAICAALSGMILVRYISGRGYPTPAAYLFAAIVCTVITAIMVTRASAFSALTYAPYLYTVPIIMIGVAAHRWAAFALAGLATAIVIATNLLLPHWSRFELRPDGYLVPLGTEPEATTVATIAILLFLCAFIAFTLERVVVTALRDTDYLATDLARAEAQITQRARDAQLAATVRAQSAALAATVQQQSSTAAQQLAALQEISATVEQFASTARLIAESGQDVQQGVAAVLHRVDRGQDSDAATSRSVEHLSTQVAAMATQVQMVEGHVGQIEEIARVLTNIADNIHLLALNATIEAAGAGSHGRRFAVVAHEVQQLAHQARQASHQVRGQVVDIQSVTAQALATTRRGKSAAGEAVAQAQETRAVHSQIGTIVQAANTQAAHIAQGTAQQQQAAGQVLQTLHTFIESMQEMAAGGRRVASAAQDLSTLAGALDTNQV